MLETAHRLVRPALWITIGVAFVFVWQLFMTVLDIFWRSAPPSLRFLLASPAFCVLDRQLTSASVKIGGLVWLPLALTLGAVTRRTRAGAGLLLTSLLAVSFCAATIALFCHFVPD